MKKIWLIATIEAVQLIFIIGVVVICVAGITNLLGCSKAESDITKNLDVFIGMEQDQIIKTLGAPSDIKTQAVYDGEGYRRSLPYILVYEKSKYDDPTIVYGISFPEGITLLSDKGFIKVEFYLEKNRVVSWLGFKVML